MKRVPNRVRSVLAMASLALLASSCRHADARATASPAFQAPLATESVGSVTTLYDNDPVESSLNLRSGQPGTIVQDHEVRNWGSNLCSGYYPDCLTVGIQGGERGAIVDLGTAQQLAATYEFTDTGTGGRGFTSIRFHQGALVVRSDREPDHLQPLREGDALRETVVAAHAPAKTGHIYLVRVVSEGNLDTYAKLIVLEFQPGVRTTFRWLQLEP